MTGKKNESSTGGGLTVTHAPPGAPTPAELDAEMELLVQRMKDDKKQSETENKVEVVRLRMIEKWSLDKIAYKLGIPRTHVQQTLWDYELE